MNPIELRPQFLVDEQGMKTAVLLSIQQYEELEAFLEDLEDAAEIERRRAEKGIPHDEAMRLVSDGGEIPG